MQSQHLVDNALPQVSIRATSQWSKRRSPYSLDDVSPDTLDRLGVTSELEKRMQNLSFCDVDIIGQSEGLWRYTGAPI